MAERSRNHLPVGMGPARASLGQDDEVKAKNRAVKAVNRRKNS
jgi:hypothetical protein